MSNKSADQTIVEIPEVLKAQLLGPRYIRVRKKQKKPIDPEWPANPLLANDPNLQVWLKEGGNYGVVGGFGLTIIDADTETIKTLVKKCLPETFTVLSPGSGGWHCYYWCSLEKPIRLFDREKENIGDIQGQGKMVVGPNCVHPKGGVYKIIDDRPLALITKEQLVETFKDYIVPEKTIHDIEITARREKQQTQLDLDILSVVPLGALKQRGGEYYGPHPVHGSEGGQNFWVNPAKNGWYCFRHGTGGGPLQWLAVEEGIIDCAEAVKGVLRGETFWEVLELAKSKGYVKEDQLTQLKTKARRPSRGRHFPFKDTEYGLFATWQNDIYYFHIVRAEGKEFLGQFSLKPFDLGNLTDKRTKAWKQIRTAIPDTILNDAALEELLTREVKYSLLNDPLPITPVTGAAQFFRYGNFQYFVPERLADVIEKTEGNRFFNLKKNTPLYWYELHRGFWRKKGEEIIHKATVRLLGDHFKKNHFEETVFLIRGRNYISKNQVENTPTKIVLENGVLDLETYGLTPFDPDLYALSALPIKFDPKADCPKIKEFLSQIVSEPEDRKTLQEWIGYHLLKNYPIRKAIMLHGSGSNGKSTLLNLIEAFLGTENITSISIHQLVSNRFMPAQLYGKLGNLSADISSDEIKRTGAFKKCTGGDTFTAEEKNQAPFSFLNFAKMTFCANQLPLTPDMSDAFFDRWIIIDFPNKFKDDDAFPLTLQTPEELSGLLNHGLEGLKRLLKNKNLTISKTTAESKKDWLLRSDPITAFINACLIIDPKGFEPKFEVYKAYVRFCEDHGFPALSDNVFAKRLRVKVDKIDDERKRIRKKQLGCWIGITLVEQGYHGDQGSRTPDTSREKSQKISGIVGRGEEKTLDHPDLGAFLETPDQTAEPRDLIISPMQFEGIIEEVYQNIWHWTDSTKEEIKERFKTRNWPDIVIADAIETLLKRGRIEQEGDSFKAKEGV